jgi:hypothetical protein
MKQFIISKEIYKTFVPLQETPPPSSSAATSSTSRWIDSPASSRPTINWAKTAPFQVLSAATPSSFSSQRLVAPPSSSMKSVVTVVTGPPPNSMLVGCFAPKMKIAAALPKTLPKMPKSVVPDKKIAPLVSKKPSPKAAIGKPKNVAAVSFSHPFIKSAHRLASSSSTLKHGKKALDLLLTGSGLSGTDSNICVFVRRLYQSFQRKPTTLFSYFPSKNYINYTDKNQ